MDHTANYAIILRHNCAVTESGGYSQFASLLAHNRTTAYCSSQFTLMIRKEKADCKDPFNIIFRRKI